MAFAMRVLCCGHARLWASEWCCVAGAAVQIVLEVMGVGLPLDFTISRAYLRVPPWHVLSRPLWYMLVRFGPWRTPQPEHVWC